MPRPDFVVTEAAYDDSHSRITRVRRWEYDEHASEVRNEHEADRTDLLEDLEAGREHYTAPRGADGELRWGSRLEVIELSNQKYVRADATPVREDNLGDLPEA